MHCINNELIMLIIFIFQKIDQLSFVRSCSVLSILATTTWEL